MSGNHSTEKAGQRCHSFFVISDFKAAVILSLVLSGKIPVASCYFGTLHWWQNSPKAFSDFATSAKIVLTLTEGKHYFATSG